MASVIINSSCNTATSDVQGCEGPGVHRFRCVVLVQNIRKAVDFTCKHRHCPSSGNLDMDAGAPPMDVPLNVLTTILNSMSLTDRFTCALVCKAWAEAAAAAARSIILRDRMQDLSCLQRWLEKHGGQVEVFQLHQRRDAALTALPCPQLQDLLLRGSLSLDGSVWDDIASAIKLTSVSLDGVQTPSQQADVVSALTALPDLEQLTWRSVSCGQQSVLTDSLLLQKLTKLTALKLAFIGAAEALQHLGLLTRLQGLSLCVTHHWAAAGCPGLQELKALTRLDLAPAMDLPPSVSLLTALQQLEVPRATPTALNKLSGLPGLTQLCVQCLEDLSPESPPLQLPGLQHLEVDEGEGTMPVSYLGRCTQLCVLKLSHSRLSCPGSLVAGSMLQHLELRGYRIIAADGVADPVSWQQVFPGPGQLPHLTSLKMMGPKPVLQHADMERVVAYCSSLQVLYVDNIQNHLASALARLSGLTSLILWYANDQDCSSLAQLTGLRELGVNTVWLESAAGLQPLVALDQLTSLGLCDISCRERHVTNRFSTDVLREHMSDQLPGSSWSHPYEYKYKYAIMNKVCVGGGVHHTPRSLLLTVVGHKKTITPPPTTHKPALQ